MTTTEVPHVHADLEFPHRRLNLSDLAIVIGFAALYCVGLRQMLRQPDETGWQFFSPHSSMRANLDVVGLPIETIGLLLLDLSMLVIVLRLRRPRPIRIQLMRQPGWVACFAATIAAIWPTIIEWASTYQDSRSITAAGQYVLVWQPALIPQLTILVVGMVVAVSWLILAMSGRWQAERSGIDRLGRVVGIAWLLLMGGMTLVNFVVRLGIQPSVNL